MTRNSGLLVFAWSSLLVFTASLEAQIGENLALMKTATQSSTLGGFEARLAVDGDRGNFTSTRGGEDLPGPAWWQVDLGETLDVGIVTLWNRTTCCGSRLRDLVVQVIAEDGQTVVYQTTDPDDPDPDALLNPENVLGSYPSGPRSLTADLGEEPVEGRFVRVYRIPDEDLSGTGGRGAPDEATVLVLGEVEVYSEGCPSEGDTFCEGLDILGPEGGDTIGPWTIAADATDDSGDFALIYVFTATHEDGAVVTATVSNGDNQAVLNLTLPGVWTIEVTVDDDSLCTDTSPEAMCTEEIFVEPLPGLTEASGLILSKAFLVLGPFAHTFGCGGAESQLRRNHIANASIVCEYPQEGDAIDYDPLAAASTSYVGPEPDGIPTWRAFDDGTPDNGDQDLSGDVGALNDVMSWLVTYVEYTGRSAVDIEFCLGSDDGGQLWFDDQLLINDSACRGRGDCDVPSDVVRVEPGVHRIAAAAWNRSGGWGLRVSMREPGFGQSIVDDEGLFPDWRFLGRERPQDFEPPACGEICDTPVANLNCEVRDDELVLSWDNPEVIDPDVDIRIVVDDGFQLTEVAVVAPEATNVTISDGDLPPGFTSISVINCSGVEVTCSPFKTDMDGYIIGEAFMILGPFSHPFKCNGPARNLEKNHLAPTEMACLYPELGDEIAYDADLEDNASTGYVGPARDSGLPFVRRFDDGSAQDGVQNLNGDLGQTNDVLSFLITYVEYVGDGPVSLGLCFSSDDGGQLWINGDRIVTNPRCRKVVECDDQVTYELDGPQILRIAAGAWNSGGSWGLRVQLLVDGVPVVDGIDNEDWVFHGTQKPPAAPPSCGDGGTGASLKPGDVNGDGMFNISDPVAQLSFLFAGDLVQDCFVVPGTVDLNPVGLQILDFNGDGGNNIADAVGALNRLFGGGAPHALGEACVELEGRCASSCGN